MHAYKIFILKRQTHKYQILCLFAQIEKGTKLLTHFSGEWERDKRQTDREHGKTINNVGGLIKVNIEFYKKCKKQDIQR